MYLEEKINSKKWLLEVLVILLGAFLLAFGISQFLLPNQLSTGGLSGVATVLYYLMQLPVGWSFLIMNIPLFLLSIYKIGKSFFIKSMIGTLALSYFVEMLDKYPPLTEDRFLACIYGGILVGLGTALILKLNGSTGGTDLISYLVRVYRPITRVGNIIILLDIIIVTINVIFFKEIEIGLYSAISIYLMGKMIDVVFEGIYFTKLLLIISDKNEEIAQEIGEKIKRGTTGLYGKGMYTKEEKLVLMCAASRGDVGKIKMMAKKIDPNCFIIITNSREVVGLGFKNT